MNSLHVRLELPRDLLETLTVAEDELQSRPKTLTMEFHREGRISSGKAVELLGTSRAAFIVSGYSTSMAPPTSPRGPASWSRRFVASNAPLIPWTHDGREQCWSADQISTPLLIKPSENELAHRLPSERDIVQMPQSAGPTRRHQICQRRARPLPPRRSPTAHCPLVRIYEFVERSTGSIRDMSPQCHWPNEELRMFEELWPVRRRRKRRYLTLPRRVALVA